MSTRYGVLPYRPEFGGSSSGGGSLADIILRGGDIQAQAHLERGRIWQDAIGGLGQTIGGAIQQHGEQKQIAKRDAAWLSFVDSGEWRDPQKAAMGVLKIWGPGPEGREQLQALGGVMQLGQEKRNPEADQKAATAIGAGMARMTEEGRARAYPQAYSLLQRTLPELAKQLPAQYDPKVWQETLAPLFASPDAGKPTVVPGNARLVGPDNQVLVDVAPPEPKAAPLITGVGPGGAPVRVEDAAGVRPYIAPREGPQSSYQSKEVMGPDGRLVLANFDARTGRYTDPATGKPIENPRPAPSDSSRQDANKYANARPAIAAVSELSERINTLQGVLAKASGAVEKAKAQVNYNDDVAEYESIVQGYTPLIARAVGHTGVLTEADVQSVRKLFPSPGDSKSLRDRKIARLESIFSALQGGGAPAPAGGGPVRVSSPEEAAKLPKGTKIILPDGSTGTVR